MDARRRLGLKKGVNTDDSRRRRGETTIQLRKQQKEEGLAKRRNIMINNFVADQSSTSEAPPSKFSDLMIKLNSNDLTAMLEGIRAFRKALSVESNPPVQECIDVGAVPIFVQFLQLEHNTDIQFEAAWALTNIASTERTQVVVDSGAITHLVKQLMSGDANVREQCAWCLGNVAGDCASYRDIILTCGGLEPLIKNVLNPENVSLLRNCVWTLSNLCRGKPQPDLRVIQPAFEAISVLLNNCGDQQTIVDACWALSYLSDGTNERIQQCVEFNVVPQLIQMIASGQTQAVVPALRTLGNIVSGEDHQTQVVVDGGALPVVVPLLSHSKKNIRKEACWMLSNIAAGNKSQVNSLVNTPSLLSQVLLQTSSSTEWDVRKEAAWVISNIATGGSKSNVLKLIENNAIEPLCDLLDVAEVRILLVSMEALESILRHGEAAKIDCAVLIDESEGVDKLELLQEHENEDVYNRAVKILETYFGGEEDDESENLAPQSSTSNSFAFGFSGQTAGTEMPKSTFDFSATPKAPISFL
mmetsp:Transcript_36856/g.68525  ORF Transcript_36856/g.68525 Transcript_36856/m.68525 type:complete len:529 (+) Transcript_36856:37-1623(+)